MDAEGIQGDAGGWQLKCCVPDLQREASIPFQPSFTAFLQAVRAAFAPGLDDRAFVLTNFSIDMETSDDLSKLAPGETIWIVDANKRLPPAKERISFPPHPKTMTRAGDYEYFAAQGRAPFPYALAELVDNSLRATIRGRASQRQIVISFALNSVSNPSSGLISVWDNGCGMTKRELNEWAVMNLSMEDRGAKPIEEAVQRGDKQAPGALRFLSGNLSYFGVGSKNAAFYLGRRIKVATRHTGSNYVHELSIGASDLEQRYRDGEAVYEEDLVHRMPGDASTLGQFEAGYPAAKAWIGEEQARQESAASCPAQDSFTRVVVGELKPEVLHHIGNASGREQLCRSLAHLYHYYLHGERGSLPGESQSHREEAPRISLECIAGRSALWQCDLADVKDDLESLYLQAQKADFHFSLDVAGKGQVEGVLYYFPFQNERETLPTEDFNLVHNPISTYNMTQQPGVPGPSQVSTSQAGQLRPTQLPLRESGSDEETEVPLWQRSRAPLFEAFWQGRLIPGARIESLPFIEAVRTKRGAAARDIIPDESFLRLRGALFFGPGFLVTRNKLTFRDNLQELLASAVAKDRSQEKLFKEWITNCHANLDKEIRFERPASEELQAEAKKHLGAQASAFERIADGLRTVERGHLVRLALRPVIVGRVEFFSVNEDVQAEGVYANGHVTIQPLPPELHGSQVRRTLPLRRIEAVLEQAEAEEHLSKELLKVPAAMLLEQQLPAGELQAGEDVPETSVVILNGSKQRVVKGTLGGDKQTYTVTQRLWFCPPGSAEGPAAEGAAEEAAQAPKAQPKKRRKKGKQPDLPAVVERPAPPVTNAELVLELENTKPSKDTFHFGSLSGRLERAGTYMLQYVMSPARPAMDALTVSARLEVAAGPAVEMAVQGEGRAAMATADLMLGEWVPDMHLVFQDQFGNVTLLGINAEDRLAIDVVTSMPDETLRRIEDLHACFNQVVAEDGSIGINSLQVIGPSDMAPGSGPLSIFKSKPQPSPEEEGLAQRPDEPEEDALSHEVKFRYSWPGLPEQLSGVRLLPGLPHVLLLLPGHCFSATEVDEAEVMGQPQGPASGLTAMLAGGAPLPDVQVQVLDQWGNPTHPIPDMPYQLMVTSPALEPHEQHFKFLPTGITTVTGFTAARLGAEAASGTVLSLRCKIHFPGVTEEEQLQEVYKESEVPKLDLGIRLQPSTAPAALKLLLDGQELPIKAGDGEGERRAVIEGVEAGSQLPHLAFMCVDEVGRPAEAGLTGKVQVSWSRGTKKVRLGQEPLQLPDIQVQEQVEAASALWVRFSRAGEQPLELGVQVTAVAAAPCSWTAEALDSQSETQGIDASGNVLCGQFFSLEITALDAFNNRCTGAISEALPQPSIQPEAANATDSLVFDTSEWEQGWVTRAGGNEVFVVKMRVGGNPGTVHLHVQDTAAEGGTSKLQTDCLDINLEPGPPTCLMFDGPAQLTCGTRSCLGELRVKATDDYGNLATKHSFEVALLPSAVNADGSGKAASVNAAGGNKARVKEGAGAFKDVRLSADQAGSYVLRAKPSSRKVAGEASLTVQMVPVNAVTAVSVAPAPGSPAAGLPAGSSTCMVVTVETENQEPIPAEAAAEGLAVKMTLPNGGRQNTQVLEPADPDSVELPSGAFAYATGPLTAAGEYTITAEYREARPEFAPSKPSKQTAVRSVAQAVQVIAGPASALGLESQTQPERLTVTNAASPQQRLLLNAVALQLRDEHGNAVEQANVPVRIALDWPSGSAQEGELPQLELAERATQKTDQQGRVFFGDVHVAEGTGRGPSNEAEGQDDVAMELRLSCSAGRRAEESVAVWSCAVLFSDDALKFSSLKKLNEQQQALTARKQEILDTLAGVREAAAKAVANRSSACKAVEARQKEVDGAKLDSVAAAEAAVAGVQQRQQESSGTGTSYDARFGPQDQAMTKAITKCLQSGGEGVLGVFAQLATVDDASLGRVLAANYRSMLVVVVVETAECRKRLEALVSKHRLSMPDVLCMAHVVRYDRATRSEVPGWRLAGPLAKSLQIAACAGSDPPIPLALPHTKAINGSRRDIPGVTLGPSEWPEGCLGYAINLVRPVLQGHRASLLYPMLGQSLVFDTLEHGQSYREYCTQVLKQPLADLVTLDLKRISGKGIISGASFRVPSLADATIRFGSTPVEQAAEATQVRYQEVALEQLLEALRSRDDAANRLEQARKAEQEMERQWQDELEDLEAQISTLNARLGSQRRGGQSSGKKRKRRGPSRLPAAEVVDAEDQENDEPANVEAEEEQPVAAKKAKPKRKRLTKMQG